VVSDYSIDVVRCRYRNVVLRDVKLEHSNQAPDAHLRHSRGYRTAMAYQHVL
jgi:hypothetical protein